MNYFQKYCNYSVAYEGYTIFNSSEELDIKWIIFLIDECEKLLVLCASNPEVIAYIEGLEFQIKLVKDYKS